MLRPAEISVILLGGLEQLHVAVSGVEPASLAESLHLSGAHWLKTACDREILMQHFERFDAADGHGNGQAHRVAQPHPGSNGALAHQLAAASEALHAERRDSAPVDFRKHVSLEATEGRVEAIERHLNGIEWEIVGKHL